MNESRINLQFGHAGTNNYPHTKKLSIACSLSCMMLKRQERRLEQDPVEEEPICPFMDWFATYSYASWQPKLLVIDSMYDEICFY